MTESNLAHDLRPKQLLQDAPVDTQDFETLATVDLADLMTAEPELPRYLVDPWLPRRHVTLLGGHGGAGKSALALALAAHVAAGERFADKVVNRDKAVVVSLEDEASIMRLRLKWIIDEYQLNHFTVLENLTLLDGTANFAALMSEMDHNAPALPTIAYSAMRELVAGAGLIVVDNASDAFDGNENSRRSVRAFIRALALVARENDAAVLLLAHIDKASAKMGAAGNSYSGSTAWHNSSRSRLALLAQEDGTLLLEQEKLNVGRRADPVQLAFSAKGVPVPVLATTSASRDGQDQRDLIRCFEAAKAADVNIPDNVTPGAYSAMQALSNLAEYPGRFQSAPGKRQVPKIITAMKRDGLLASEEYQRPNRKKGRRLMLTSGAKLEVKSS